jgi:transcriptional regulator with GAF, ATPase, and Fis domain
MKAFLDLVERVKDSGSSLLILGETGVGKERLARAIHAESPRGGGAFVPVNCGALPEGLLESELFGHEEGAFTGATRGRRGRFELAHGGTLFLDEIGEMPVHLQVKLLRALQEHEIQPLGGERSIPVDVRLMAASNRDLAVATERGEFRKDLYYRLGVVTLVLPPLRERREDIPELAESYVDHFRAVLGRETETLRPEALEALIAYEWPGNVRELINVIERAVLLCDGPEIGLEHLPEGIARRGAGGTTLPPLLLDGEAEELPRTLLARPWREVRRDALARLERAYLGGLLEETKGRIGETARRAGMEPRSLYEKMRRHGLAKEDFRE